MFTGQVSAEEAYRDEILRQAKQSISQCFSMQRNRLHEKKQAIELIKEERLKNLELAKNTLLQQEENMRLFRQQATRQIDQEASTMKTTLKSVCTVRVGVQVTAQIGINAKEQLTTSDRQVTFTIK